MADHRNIDIKAKHAGPARRLTPSVAGPMLSIVRKHSFKLNDAVYDALYQAALSLSPEDAVQAVKHALATGTAPEDIAEIYVPALARRMGDDWCVDQLSFAKVTIGASRLQTMLRSLGSCWSGDKGSDPDAPSLLLIVPPDVFHTLGAIVLGGQLRRKGYSVKLLLGGKAADIAENIDQNRFEAVFISSSMGETIESLRQIVDVIRASTRTPLPVVVGGTILEVETVENVTALTGADHATKIPDEALRLCGLKPTTHTTAQVLHGT